jgi:hypothetical protein
VLSRIIDAGGEYRNTLDDVQQGLFVGAGARSAKLTQFFVRAFALLVADTGWAERGQRDGRRDLSSSARDATPVR